MNKKIDSRFIDAEMTTDSELAVETEARQTADSALDVRITTLENNTNIVTSINGQTGNVIIPLPFITDIDGGSASESLFDSNVNIDGGTA